jgi:hypothetical protein
LKAPNTEASLKSSAPLKRRLLCVVAMAACIGSLDHSWRGHVHK